MPELLPTWATQKNLTSIYLRKLSMTEPKNYKKALLHEYKHDAAAFRLLEPIIFHECA